MGGGKEMVYQNGKTIAMSSTSSAGEFQDIYSTEEQVIGQWIDGKPLYRKVISFSIELPGYSENTYSRVPMSGYIQNIETCVDITGKCSSFLATENTTITFTVNGILMGVDWYSYDNTLFIKNREFSSKQMNYTFVLALTYTKNTDAASSNVYIAEPMETKVVASNAKTLSSNKDIF